MLALPTAMLPGWVGLALAVMAWRRREEVAALRAWVPTAMAELVGMGVTIDRVAARGSKQTIKDSTLLAEVVALKV